MPQITPTRRNVRAFKTQAAFEKWLESNHDKKSELHLRIFKKDSGKATVTYAQAVEVALCWGWIDGIGRSYDAQSYLQRFTPRRPRSLWSQLNRERVARLHAAGRMTPRGLAVVAEAKASGRWQAAYASPKNTTVPEDLLAAIQAEPRAWATFQKLNKQNMYALAFRLGNIITPTGRAKRVAAFVDMLRRGKTPLAKRTTTRAPAGKPIPKPKTRASAARAKK